MIRFATLDDLKNIAGLRYKMFAEIGTTHCLVDNFITQTVAFYSEQYRLNRCIHAVKEDKGILVGCAGGILRSDTFNQRAFKYAEYGYIMDVYVEPMYRKQGIAHTLTQKAVEWLQTKEIISIKLNASRLAGNLYGNMGFKNTNEMSLEVPLKTGS